MKSLTTLLLSTAISCLSTLARAGELVAEFKGKPFVFNSAAGEFSGKNEARTVRFSIDRLALPKQTERLAVILRIRATNSWTERVEFGIHQSNGKVWGSTSLPITEFWQDIPIPLDRLSPFSHWQGHPVVDSGEMPEVSLFDSIHFCFGKWLCRSSVNKPHGFEVSSVRIMPLPADWPRNMSLTDFPRTTGEEDDSPRFQRAIDYCAGAVLSVPRGVYILNSPLCIANCCSLELDKGAVLKAQKRMDVILSVNARSYHINGDHGMFIRGGVFDGNGKAACLRLKGVEHFTLERSQFFNALRYGLRVDGGCELIANNLYFRCFMKGLKGNSAIYVNGGDSHYTDCIIIDYTYGVRQVSGGSNRYTRCHVWGGPVREMLEDSVNFKLEGGSSTTFRDCYADTGKTGYEIAAWETRLLGCCYFNNPAFKLDDITIIRHKRGRLLVSEGHFCKTVPHTKVYEGTGEVVWSHITYSGFAHDDDCPGNLTYSSKVDGNRPAVNLAE